MKEGARLGRTGRQRYTLVWDGRGVESDRDSPYSCHNLIASSINVETFPECGELAAARKLRGGTPQLYPNAAFGLLSPEDNGDRRDTTRKLIASPLIGLPATDQLQSMAKPPSVDAIAGP